jgi:hypothetical protein
MQHTTRGVDCNARAGTTPRLSADGVTTEHLARRGDRDALQSVTLGWAEEGLRVMVVAFKVCPKP